MAKLPARLRPAGFGFAALLVLIPLDIKAQMSGGAAGFGFPAERDPPGLRSPKKQNDKAKLCDLNHRLAAEYL